MSPSLLPRGQGLTFKQTVFPRRRPVATASPVPTADAHPAPARGRKGRRSQLPVGETGVAPSELETKRAELSRTFAEMQWDLGGMAYEMAIRDHFRLDLLVRKAAELQSVDAELGSAEQLLRMDQAGAAGSCSSCGALFPRGGVYCGQCGNDLVRRETVDTTAVQPAPAPPPAQPGFQSTPEAAADFPFREQAHAGSPRA